VPDIIDGKLWIFSENRVEEILIFLLGATAFLIFIKSEQKLIFHKKEKEKDQKKINQTVKDLVESYSYIGEVNRKIDILMSVALGFSDSSNLNKSQEEEIYKSIVIATNSLLKAESTSLRLIDIDTKKTKKESRTKKENNSIKNSELLAMEEKTTLKKNDDCLIISSGKKINGVKSYLIICGYDKEEESNSKNLEIIKVFVSQALFIYAYAHQEGNTCPCPPTK
jgi:hypothetical protein